MVISQLVWYTTQGFFGGIMNHNWVAVLLDVVVVGILVAMQLANWEESKNESDKVQSLLITMYK